MTFVRAGPGGAFLLCEKLMRRIINVTEALITGAVALAVCMINNHFQQRSAREQNDKATALVAYRLEQLENKVQAHNNLVERMYHVEERTELQEEKIKVANHRIADLEKERKEHEG